MVSGDLDSFAYNSCVTNELININFPLKRPMVVTLLTISSSQIVVIMILILIYLVKPAVKITQLKNFKH